MAFYSVHFCLEMTLPLNFGRPIVRTQKAKSLLFTFWPIQL